MNADRSSRQAIDDELVRTIARWSLVVTACIAAFDVAILWNYPFPLSSTWARGLFYSLAGIALVLGALACAFLGYRIISLRLARRSWRTYAYFLPLMALLGSAIWLYLLSPA